MNLVWHGNWLGRETGLVGKVVWQENLIFVTLAKITIVTVVVKQITYNVKISDITIL